MGAATVVDIVMGVATAAAITMLATPAVEGITAGGSIQEGSSPGTRPESIVPNDDFRDNVKPPPDNAKRWVLSLGYGCCPVTDLNLPKQP
jgi:hypothetical protein